MKFWIEIANELIEWAFKIDIDCEFDFKTKETTDWIIWAEKTIDWTASTKKTIDWIANVKIFDVMSVLLKWEIVIENVIEFVEIVEIINRESFVYNAN
jgi:hypothetical protein